MICILNAKNMLYIVSINTISKIYYKNLKPRKIIFYSYIRSKTKKKKEKRNFKGIKSNTTSNIWKKSECIQQTSLFYLVSSQPVFLLALYPTRNDTVNIRLYFTDICTIIYEYDEMLNYNRLISTLMYNRRMRISECKSHNSALKL